VGNMLVQAGVVTIEDNCIHIDKFKITQETTLKEARLLALDWAADEIKAAISSEMEEEMKKIFHSNIDCPRVKVRLMCDDCGYPASEARYHNESEIPENQIQIEDGEEWKDGISGVDVSSAWRGTRSE